MKTDPIRRRKFAALLMAAAASWPFGAGAQQAARRPRVGVLIYSTPQADPNTRSFQRGMSDLGYVEGKNIDIDYRFAEGKPERLPALAADLIRMKPEIGRASCRERV